MIDAIRRQFVRGVKHGFALVLAFLVVGYGLSLMRPSPAQADEAVDNLKAVVLSDVSLGERLMALNSLKRMGGSAATDALAAIAAGGKLPVASAACAQLGRLKSSASKGKLKSVLENTNLGDDVRIAAAACIAEHWKDSGDISYLESRCSGNAKLSAHLAVLKRSVYKVQ